MGQSHDNVARGFKVRIPAKNGFVLQNRYNLHVESPKSELNTMLCFKLGSTGSVVYVKTPITLMKIPWQELFRSRYSESEVPTGFTGFTNQPANMNLNKFGPIDHCDTVLNTAGCRDEAVSVADDHVTSGTVSKGDRTAVDISSHTHSRELVDLQSKETYKPTKCHSTDVRGKIILETLHIITAMKEYEHTSFEELRFVYYNNLKQRGKLSFNVGCQPKSTALPRSLSTQSRDQHHRSRRVSHNKSGKKAKQDQQSTNQMASSDGSLLDHQEEDGHWEVKNLRDAEKEYVLKKVLRHLITFPLDPRSYTENMLCTYIILLRLFRSVDSTFDTIALWDMVQEVPPLSNLHAIFTNTHDSKRTALVVRSGLEFCNQYYEKHQLSCSHLGMRLLDVPL